MVGDDGDGDGPLQLLDLLLATDADGQAALTSSAARAGQESGGLLGLAGSTARAGLTGEESGGILALGLASSSTARAGGGAGLTGPDA